MRGLKFILIIVLGLIAGSADARKSTNLQRQRKTARQQVQVAEQRLQANREAIKKNLNELNLLEGEIGVLDKNIKRLNATSDSLKSLIGPLSDTLSVMSSRLENMRTSYAKVLRNTYLKSSELDEISFVFSASSFSQAWRRASALKQFSKWRRQKSEEILSVKRQMEERKLRLDSLSDYNSRVMAGMKTERKALDRKKDDVNKLVKQLEATSAELEKEIERRNAEMAVLDAKIEDAMAEEERERQEEERRKKEDEARKIADSEAKTATADKEKNKPEADTHPNTGTGNKINKNTEKGTDSSPDVKTLTSRFEELKGRMPYPVKGKHVIVKKFGRQKHPRLSKVYTENAGIDFETESGADVYAVSAGEVSQIFKIGGYNNVVVIRHGDYVTVYANVVDLKVAKGDMVAAGDILGAVFVDSKDGNRSILHFELRKGKEKQDPEAWLK